MEIHHFLSYVICKIIFFQVQNLADAVIKTKIKMCQQLQLFKIVNSIIGRDILESALARVDQTVNIGIIQN